MQAPPQHPLVPLVLCALAWLSGAWAQAQLTPENLTCEYVANPRGVESPHPRLGWSFPMPRAQRGQFQSAYQIQVATSPQALQFDAPDLWDSGKLEGNANFQIPYAGKSLAPDATYFWRVRVWDASGKPGLYSAPATFDTGLREPADWQGAQWTAWRTQSDWKRDFDARIKKQLAEPPRADTGWPYPKVQGKSVVHFNLFEMYGFHEPPHDPAPLFRKAFSVEKPVKRARLYVSAIGYYEASLNGARVGDHLLDPGWADDSQHVLYSVYDVTDALRQGPNALGVMLGRGAPGSFVNDVWNAYKSAKQPAFLLRMSLEYADGTRADIVSGADWKVAGGPVVFDDFFRGEIFDARRAQPGWNTPGFSDSGWETPAAATPPAGKLSAQLMPPIRATSTYKPVAVRNPKPGVSVFDFGANRAGWARLKLSGPAGTQVLLRYSETDSEKTPLPDPAAYYGNYQQHGLILSGQGEDVFEPRFNYTGFRYVVVEGAPGPLTADNIEAVHVHTDVPSAGEFSAENPLLNRIQSAVRLTFLNNLHSIPTDCPTREKHGWLGDAHLAAETGIFNFDMAAFYENWTTRMWEPEMDNQKGQLYYFTPRLAKIVGYSPCWEAAAVIIPWYLYTYYGDRQVLETWYPAMRRYVDALELGRVDKNVPHIVREKYGDWLHPKEGQPPVNLKESPAAPKEGLSFYGTAYYAYTAQLLSQMAAALGKTEDAAHYAELAQDIRTAFNEKFYDPQTQTYRGENREITEYRQSPDAVALALGLVPETRQPRIVENLLADLARRNQRLNTGILGTKALMEALPAHGAGEAAFALAVQTKNPSWGDMLVNQGATAITEAWGGVGSRNHPAFASVGAYYYRWLAGIQPDPSAPGFRHFFLRPTFIPGLAGARATYKSPSGLIGSRWQRDEKTGLISWDILIPVNTTATVQIPVATLADVRESNTPLAQSPGISAISSRDGKTTFTLASGQYRVSFPILHN